jgi:hypothetical protein
MRATYMHPAHIAGFGAHGAMSGGAVAPAVMLGLCLLGLLIVMTVMLIQLPTDRRDGTDGDWGSGGGGPGPKGGGPGGPHPTGDDPEWWPEFERQFAEYVRSTIRAQATKFRPGVMDAKRNSPETTATFGG